MSVCEVCGNRLSSSYYHLPAEIKEETKNHKIKFVHMECCSVEQIKQNLLSYAENQVALYHDIINLVKDTSLKKIKDIQDKYGTYDEISQDIQIDRDLMISALISELKRKTALE
jgi:galactitol-specific phosphotransferase system IIB component